MVLVQALSWHLEVRKSMGIKANSRLKLEWVQVAAMAAIFLSTLFLSTASPTVDAEDARLTRTRP